MKIIYALLLVLMTGCCALTSDYEAGMPKLVPKIDADEMARTIIRYTTKLKRDRGLTFEDSRTYYSECTERIRLVLASQKMPEIKEARDELVDVVDGLLNALNNNPILRVDACEQYYTVDMLEIYISYESYFTEYVDPFYVCWTSLDQGLTTFYMGTIKEYYYDRWHTRIEPYYKTKLFRDAQKEADVIYPPKKVDAYGDDIDSKFIDANSQSRVSAGLRY